MDRNQIIFLALMVAPVTVVLVVALLKGYDIAIRRKPKDDKDP